MKYRMAAQNSSTVCKMIVTPGQLYSTGYSTFVIQIATPMQTIEIVLHAKNQSLMEGSSIRLTDAIFIAINETILKNAGAMWNQGNASGALIAPSTNIHHPAMKLRDGD